MKTKGKIRTNYSVGRCWVCISLWCPGAPVQCCAALCHDSGHCAGFTRMCFSCDRVQWCHFLRSHVGLTHPRAGHCSEELLCLPACWIRCWSHPALTLSCQSSAVAHEGLGSHPPLWMSWTRIPVWHHGPSWAGAGLGAALMALWHSLVVAGLSRSVEPFPGPCSCS